MNEYIEYKNTTCVSIVTVQRGFENVLERERDRQTESDKYRAFHNVLHDYKHL
jgi:hypothetical protein